MLFQFGRWAEFTPAHIHSWPRYIYFLCLISYYTNIWCCNTIPVSCSLRKETINQSVTATIKHWGFRIRPFLKKKKKFCPFNQASLLSEMLSWSRGIYTLWYISARLIRPLASKLHQSPPFHLKQELVSYFQAEQRAHDFKWDVEGDKMTAGWQSHLWFVVN